ncbi:protein charlatan isoform X2 [Toxorhynchites rutilus septentrionalis]|uniref:protein charlatan isoform X2 n=1 Tax=Toxorhynchites rutilus septentrionalis TaxID=329112 RepID=UPI00247A89EE|nr:protein charlatan isoform X2 [Toxorhynchites rutilus septentrionalis]
MTTLIPTSQPTGVEAYEDMFKEITRKLYGEESAHGLYPHNTQVAQVAQLATGAPAAPEGGERSFTTLVSDRSLTQIDYETTTVNDQQQNANQQHQQQAQQQQQPLNSFKSEDHLTTAFGLAALMQNGFPPPGAILNPVNFPVAVATKPSTNISTAANNDERWQPTQQTHPQDQQQQQQQPSEQTWNTGGKHSSSSYSQKGFKKPKIEPQEGSPTTNGCSTLNIPQTTGSDKKGNFGSAAVGAPTGKRYGCSSCPYTTDRRDLFTRHENIHKEEKPFHCYACLKQFNRADHVKKHFLRMHRDMEYEIAKTRRTVSSKSYYNNNNNNNNTNSAAIPAANTQPAIPQTPQTVQASTLNIPTATFPTQITIPTHHAIIEHNSHANNHDIGGGTLNGALHHGQHPAQQPQSQSSQQILTAPPIVAIKQEKGSTIVTNNTSDSSLTDEKPNVKKLKGEKRFTCCYCPWSGADNWGLKRHLNTHTKPFVCMLCDYKAARSERLATHVFKVHNKKACNKCNFFAEDQAQLNAHQLEAHPHETNKPAKSSSGSTINTTTGGTSSAGTGNVLRNLGNTFVPNNLHGNNTSGNSFGTTTNTNVYHTATTTTGNILTNSNASNLIDTINQHLASTGAGSGNGIGGGVGQVAAPQHHQHHHQQQQQQQQQQQHQQQTHHWIAKVNRKRGAELLFSYLEADGSDSEDYARLLNMQAIGRNKASVTQDFHNAGGGNHQLVSNSSSSSNGTINGISTTNKLSLLVAATTSASCSPLPSSPSRSPSCSPTASPAADCPTNQTEKQVRSPTNSSNVGSQSASPAAQSASLTEEHLSLLQLLATAAVAQQQQHLQQQKATSTTTTTTSITSPPANHPQQLNHAHQHHQNSTNNGHGSIGDGPHYPNSAINGSKRRRKSNSRNDKENQIHHRPAPLATVGKAIDLSTTGGGGGGGGPGENGIERNSNSSSNNNNSSVNNKNTNETIFDRVYKKPYNMFLPSAFCKTVIEEERTEGKENFSLAEFLRNHQEVSISTLANNNNNNNSHQVHATKTTTANGIEEDVVFVKEEKRLGRKQNQPRKLDSEQPDSSPRKRPDASEIADIRDKHMIRLVTRRMSCRICQHQQRLENLDNCHYHSKTSLILHNLWRHRAATANRCKSCGEQFPHRYKLILHQKTKHRSQKVKLSPKKNQSGAKKNSKGSSSVNGIEKKKQQRKQRKRKPRSRCFTKRRK